MTKRLILIALILAMLSAFVPEIYAQGQTGNQKKVAIVCTDSSTASIRSLKGIKQSFKYSEIQIRIDEVHLKSLGEQATLDRITTLNPDLVISVGSPSTIFIKENFPDLPLIFSTVLNPETSGILDSLESNKLNITGASLDIPVEIQLQKFLLVYPNLKKVGVIYTDQTGQLIEEAKRLTPNMGLELVAIKIKSDKQVPRALDSLCQVVDGIWTTADDMIYTPQATKFMLLASLRNQKPIMGFSPSFVKNGALLGLNYDYKDIGRRAGELAIRYFNGEQLKSIPIAHPGVIYLHINLKTAQQLGIEVDQGLVDISKEIYE